MKSKLKYLLIIIPLLFIGIQFLWYIKANGNLIIYVSNWSQKENNIELIIEIDGEKEVEELLDEETFHNYLVVPLKLKLGSHSIKVYDKGKTFSLEKNLSLFSVRWLTFEISDNINGGLRVNHFANYLPPTIE